MATSAPAPARLAPTVASVCALLVGLVVAVGLLGLAGLTSLCEVGGNTCSDEHQRTMDLATVGAGLAFLGVPALVAVARRDARWLYAPFIEVIVGMSIATVVVAF